MPTRTEVRLTLLSIGTPVLRQNMSSKPMMNRLNRLLPKASPTARSGASTSVMALTPVPSSGREVAVASKTTPMNDRPKPVFSAITSADFARKFEARSMKPAAARSCIHSAGMDWANSVNCSPLFLQQWHTRAKNDPDVTGS